MKYSYFVSCQNITLEDFRAFIRYVGGELHIMDITQNWYTEGRIDCFMHCINILDDLDDDIEIEGFKIYREPILTVKQKNIIMKDCNIYNVYTRNHVPDFDNIKTKKIPKKEIGASVIHIPTRISVKCFGFNDFKKSSLLAARAVTTIHHTLFSKDKT